MYTFPRTKHIYVCSFAEQVEHLCSEVVEVERAYATPYVGQVGEELCDVIHSAETGLRMLEDRNGCELVAGVECSIPASSVLALFPQIKRLSKQAELVRRAFASGSIRRTALALADVIGAAEVALQTLARAYHVDVDACRRNVVLKNQARGYYDSGEDV